MAITYGSYQPLDYSKALLSGGLTTGNNTNNSSLLSGMTFGSLPAVNLNNGGITSLTSIPKTSATPSGSIVLGASTTNPFSGGNYGTTNNGITNSQSAADKAYIDSLNTNFDKLKSQSEGLLSQYGNDLSSAESQANIGLDGVKSAVESKKTQAQQAKDTNIMQAADTANNAVRANRNTLRALGILSSTAGGDLLTRPMNDFEKVRASYVQDYENRVNELDNILIQETAKNKATLDSLRSQYNTLKNNIMNDLRFNERERADALNAANAAISSRISQVKTQQQTIANRVNELRSNYDTLMSNIANQKALTSDNFNPAEFLKNAEISFNQQFNPATASVMTPEQKKKEATFGDMLLSGGLK